jgi:thiamine-monophosphate kinase
MNEFQLINRLKSLLPLNDSVVVGAGDDCAVLAPPAAGQQQLFKTDAVVEGVHFTAETPGEKPFAEVHCARSGPWGPAGH